MKIFQLLYFCTACRFKNITRAAEYLHVSQPSVSHAIRSLESEFGLPLLDRDGRGFALTSDGEYLYREGRTLLDRAEALHETMTERGRLGAAVLRFGSAPMAGAGVTQRLYREVGGARGALSVHLVEGGRPRLLSMIDENLLDFALVSVGDLPREEYGVLELFREELVLCVLESSPLARLKTIESAVQLADTPLAMFNDKYHSTGLILEYFRRQNVTPRIVCYAEQVFTVMEFVSKGAAAGPLYRGMTARWPGVVEIPFAEPMTLEMGFVWKKSSPKARDLEREIRRLADVLVPSTHN